SSSSSKARSCRPWRRSRRAPEMALPRLVLFDLDGTLIDSQAGILGSLRHAFARIEAKLPEEAVLRGWIGPPFHETFPQVLGDDEARIELAIAHYREHYEASGWAEHEVYPGIADLIGALDAAGCQLAIVTTKIEPQARRIAAHLPFGGAFARVYGAGHKTRHSAKAEMIAQALADFGTPPSGAVMVGDRHFDIAGARANDVRALGVSWGFGSVEELEDAGAHAIAASPAALAELLLTGEALSVPAGRASF